MKSLSLAIVLACTTFAMAYAEPGKNFLIQVDNEKILLDGSELSSMDVLRTIVANASKETVISVEALSCTKWRRIEEVMEILRERPVPFTVKFSTFGDSDDPVCRRSRSAV